VARDVVQQVALEFQHPLGCLVAAERELCGLQRERAAALVSLDRTNRGQGPVVGGFMPSSLCCTRR